MSEFSMFPHSAALEHHILEVLAVQWDGSKEKALAIASDLKAELPLRDAELISAHHQHGASTMIGEWNELKITIERRSDGQEWESRVARGGWLAIWLHKDRVYMVTPMAESEGEVFFRRVAPVVRLHERQSPLTLL